MNADKDGRIAELEVKLTERQRVVADFAIYRFMNESYARANEAAQDLLNIRYKKGDCQKFIDDARTAEELRDIFAAAPKPQGESND